MHRSGAMRRPLLSSLFGGARAHHRHGTTGRDRRYGGSRSRARICGLALELEPSDLCPATCGRRRAAQCVAIRVGWRPLHRVPFPPPPRGVRRCAARRRPPPSLTSVDSSCDLRPATCDLRPAARDTYGGLIRGAVRGWQQPVLRPPSAYDVCL
jgi:hypothetical protein